MLEWCLSCIVTYLPMAYDDDNDDIVIMDPETIFYELHPQEHYQTHEDIQTHVEVKEDDHIQIHVEVKEDYDIPFSCRLIKSIQSRLRGKDGRIRGSLSSKRIEYAKREVFTLNPVLSTGA